MNGAQTPSTESHFDRLDRRLEHLEMLMAIALAEPLAKLREPHDASDSCSATILRFTTDWISAGDLKTRVRVATGDSESTIKRRIKDLRKLGALDAEGARASQRYRNTFLLG